MEMRFFGVTEQVKHSFFNIRWHHGKENLENSFTKHFDDKHHREVRPWNLHEQNSPRILSRAIKPSALRGCVGTLFNGYINSSPLPRVNPKVRVNHRSEYRAQLALQASTATQCQLLQRTIQPANSIAMVLPWFHLRLRLLLIHP